MSQPDAPRFPYVPVAIQVQGQALRSNALLDTGFDGAVIVPAGCLGAGVHADTQRRWQLADGSIVHAPAYLGEFQLAGLPSELALITELGEEFLIGVDAIRGFRVVLDRGQQVTVEA